MLLEQTSKEFGARFLLSFIKEVIENTESYQKFKIKEEAKDIQETGKLETGAEEIEATKKEEIREIVQERIKEDSKKLSEMYIKGLPLELEALANPIRPAFRRTIRRTPPLRIYEPSLPPTVSYLKPLPTSEEIELGKLDILVRDPLVKIIECNGPNENVFVIGIMGRKPTAIRLGSEEVEQIVGNFAAISKIPVHEGLFKAAVGRLVISAVVSEIAGIKFVIRKIS